MTKNSCCSYESGCCDKIEERLKKIIIIDLLYLDLSVCTRCQGTDDILEDALAEVSNVLKVTDVDVVLNKVNVNTAKLAQKHQFISSPTIRVNGLDIQLEVKEDRCESCGDLCGDEVDCRVWVYHGKEYIVPPKSMIIEAILKAVYGTQEVDELTQTEYKLPENLKRFYTALESKQKNISTCCD